jgi:alkylation response protein AidB-like acyl-CoA dehydrogenase
MDYSFSEEQLEVLAALKPVLGKHAGSARARHVMAGAGIDTELIAELAGFGIFEREFVDEYGSLMLAPIVEEIVEHAAVVPIGTELFVRALADIGDLPGPIALVQSRGPESVPYASQAQTVLLIEDDRVWHVEDGVTIGAENRTFPIPVAPITVSADAGVRELPIDGRTLNAIWRLGLAAEIVGASTGALRITVEHLTAREQFGRPLASFQVIQHRLAEVHVRIEGARWLCRHAAWHSAAPLEAAVAATSAMETARIAMWELQQLQGAIGFTTEYDLHLFTLRAHVLRQAMEGASGSHAIAAAEERWLRSVPA